MHVAIYAVKNVKMLQLKVYDFESGIPCYQSIFLTSFQLIYTKDRFDKLAEVNTNANNKFTV